MQQLQDFDSLPDIATVRMPVVKAVSGMSHTTIYRLAKAGKFPKPKKLSENIVAWSVGELRAFLASRAAV